MSTLATSSYRQFRRPMGLPVVISLTRPSWRDDAQDWPACHMLQPRWRYFYAEGKEFDRQYLAQLERFGVPKIAACLHQIAAEHGDAERLVLICHESKQPVIAETCHRRLFAGWWEQATGQEVDELDGTE